MVSTDVRQRLEEAEARFLCSVSEGADAVESFSKDWSVLLSDLSEAIETGEVDEATMALAYDVSTRVSEMTNAFIEFQATTDSLTSQLKEEFQASSTLLSEAAVCLVSSPSLSDRPHRPSFTLLCYKWLLRNIHNPYPSRATKEDIAKASNASLSSIDTWFQSARRRMGWTTISKTYFNNCRQDVVAAASRVLLEEGREAPQDACLTHEFLEMKARAQGLCAHVYKKSKLASDLDVSVKDITEADRLRTERKKKDEEDSVKRRKEMEKELRRLQRAKGRLRNKLAEEFGGFSPCSARSFRRPPPALSRTPSLTLSQSSGSDSDGDLSELEDLHEFGCRIPILGKRRALVDVSHSGPYRLGTSSQVHATSPGYSLTASVSSDNAPTLDTDTQGQCGALVNQGAIHTYPGVVSSRKRRSSHSFGAETHNRPRGLPAGRFCVSDPLPSFQDDRVESLDIAQTFPPDNLFDLESCPVTLGGLDHTAEFDIELFRSWPKLDDYDTNGYSSITPSTGIETAWQPASDRCSDFRLHDIHLDVSRVSMLDLLSDSPEDVYMGGADQRHRLSATESSYSNRTSPLTPMPLSAVVSHASLNELDLSQFLDVTGVLTSSTSSASSREQIPTDTLDSCVSSTLLNNQAATILALDKQTKLQQYMALQEAAAQIERELLVV
ncbi:hypothetical protein GLOTRDRAFT_89930 [Gloeophyllum trabeum ATCC 11539]|uniref:Homeobox domain-containing protein n=1 Tax=Gloeophyllum trabeum (strain ATCC 11539 / FP-39264 / Madison 617) TaxID=670483 RepID=S7QLT6_GLOTA|nr:uncharacterized protein GLOTRDRAFT_89930 [Gloeophyllum trabeum ATCC 11539]EPQ60408.1 hypothetical protein GLOTRDRAFT_89930 [Gloeophyllum trabeum ATCC 11539]